MAGGRFLSSARKLLLRGRAGITRERGCEEVWGERGMNGGCPRRFHALFERLVDAWGEAHEVFSYDHEHSFPSRYAKIYFGSGYSWG
jgi:hypothetical protein